MSRYKGGYTITKRDRCPSGEMIEEARMDKDLSMVQVAKLARLAPATVCNMERYGVATARVGTLLALCKVLELDPMELIKADVGQVL